MLEFGGEEDGDGAAAEGAVWVQANSCLLRPWGPICSGAGGDGRSGAAGLPTGLPLQLLLCRGLWISLYLNNSDKMSVTMATRENKLI